MKHAGLWLCLTLLVGVAPGLRAQSEDCSPGLEPRLTVSELARVTPGDANNVRSQPNASAALVGQIPGGGIFEVLDGPDCSDSLTWWQVRYGDITGWTVEGSGEYWLEPLELAVYQDGIIRFGYDPATMGDITFEIIEADPANESQGGPYPEQIRYDINTWPAGEENEFFANARITLTRTADIEASMWRFDGPLQGISTILSDGTTDGLWEIDHPVSGAAQLGIAIPQITPFVNGAGVSYATAYAQDIFEFVPNRFHFIGLTNDNVYMIFLSFDMETAPSSVPFDRMDYLDTDYQNFDAYDAYTQQVAAQIAQRPDDAFTPNLAILRLMVESIEIVGDWHE